MVRSQEKRKALRIQPYVAPCRLTVEQTMSGFVVELSVAGARVSCEDDPPPVGSRVLLEVRLGNQVAHSRIAAEVKWVRWMREGRHDFGVTFTEVTPVDQKVLEGIVEEFKRRAAQLA